MELLFFAAAFVSEIIGTIAGFGSSTVFLPLALFFVDFRVALLLVAILHIFGNLGRIGYFRHGLDRIMLIRFGIPSILATLLGAFSISFVSHNLLKGLLGVFLILYSLLNFWKEDLKIKSSLLSSVIGGSLSGFLAGLIGTGGALRGAFLTGFGLSKEKYIATAAAIALAVDITRIPVYLSQGSLEKRFYWYVPVLLLIAFVGSFVGKKIVDKIPQSQFKKIVLTGILMIGVKFVYDWVS